MKFQINSVIEKILFYIQFETFLSLWALLIFGFAFYYFFLKAISEKRHRNLKRRFKNTLIYLSLASALAFFQWSFLNLIESSLSVLIFEYIAFFALIFAAFSTVKIAQILVYLGLFYKNMSQGIPRLIVNLFTVVFSILVFSLLASEIFSIHLTAMLATSAVFSLVLGLALQDTLGNLFSGVAMQIGQAFKIGDWVEIRGDGKIWLGQVQEITWRSTFILTFADEMVMIPNKVIAQSQIMILTGQTKPNRENLTFRLNFEEDVSRVKSIVLAAVGKVSGLYEDPAPRVLLMETTDSWITLKVFYSVKDYSQKFRIADQILENVLGDLQKNQIRLATPKLTYLNQNPNLN